MRVKNVRLAEGIGSQHIPPLLKRGFISPPEKIKILFFHPVLLNFPENYFLMFVTQQQILMQRSIEILSFQLRGQGSPDNIFH